MSRIGKKPVPVPGGVTAAITDGTLTVKGPKGTLSLTLVSDISYEIGESGISVQPANDTKQARAFWGMQRTLVENLVTGVTTGYTKVLEINGVGYRANSQGRNLKLQLGCGGMELGDHHVVVRCAGNRAGVTPLLRARSGLTSRGRERLTWDGAKTRERARCYSP